MEVCTRDINARENFANPVKNALSHSLDTRIKYLIYSILVCVILVICTLINSLKKVIYITQYL